MPPAYQHLDPALADRLIEQAGLGDVAAKVAAGERLTFEDGMRLYETPHLAAVGHLAHRVRTRLHGDKVFFNNNLHINYLLPESSCTKHDIILQVMVTKNMFAATYAPTTAKSPINTEASARSGRTGTAHSIPLFTANSSVRT